MIITPANREAHLRSKSKFYVAGWVASEGNEVPQKRPTNKNPDHHEYYEDYVAGYGEEKANAYALSLPPFNVAVEKTGIV